MPLALVHAARSRAGRPRARLVPTAVLAARGARRRRDDPADLGDAPALSGARCSIDDEDLLTTAYALDSRDDRARLRASARCSRPRDGAAVGPSRRWRSRAARARRRHARVRLVPAVARRGGRTTPRAATGGSARCGRPGCGRSSPRRCRSASASGRWRSRCRRSARTWAAARWAGVLLAVWSFGSATGGIIYGARRGTLPLARDLVVLAAHPAADVPAARARAARSGSMPALCLVARRGDRAAAGGRQPAGRRRRAGGALDRGLHVAHHGARHRALAAATRSRACSSRRGLADLVPRRRGDRDLGSVLRSRGARRWVGVATARRGLSGRARAVARGALGLAAGASAAAQGAQRPPALAQLEQVGDAAERVRDAVLAAMADEQDAAPRRAARRSGRSGRASSSGSPGARLGPAPSARPGSPTGRRAPAGRTTAPRSPAGSAARKPSSRPTSVAAPAALRPAMRPRRATGGAGPRGIVRPPWPTALRSSCSRATRPARSCSSRRFGARPGVLGLTLELERFDLSLERRRATANEIVHEAARAMREAGYGMKAATITPEGARRRRLPNRILREEVDGKVIIRTGRRIPGVTPVAGVHHPISVVRMAVEDAYGAEAVARGRARAPRRDRLPDREDHARRPAAPSPSTRSAPPREMGGARLRRPEVDRLARSTRGCSRRSSTPPPSAIPTSPTSRS